MLKTYQELHEIYRKSFRPFKNYEGFSDQRLWFASEHIPGVMNDSIKMTYLIGDKYDAWEYGDIVAVMDAGTKEQCGFVEIIDKWPMRFADIPTEGHETILTENMANTVFPGEIVHKPYGSREQLKQEFQEYYPDQQITDDTGVWALVLWPVYDGGSWDGDEV